MYLFQFISGAVPSCDIITKDLPILDSSKKSIKTEEVPVTNSSEVQLNSIENHDANPEISSSRVLVLADTDTYTITATFGPDVHKAPLQNFKHSNPCSILYKYVDGGGDKRCKSSLLCLSLQKKVYISKLPINR